MKRRKTAQRLPPRKSTGTDLAFEAVTAHLAMDEDSAIAHMQAIDMSETTIEDLHDVVTCLLGVAVTMSRAFESIGGDPLEVVQAVRAAYEVPTGGTTP